MLELVIAVLGSILAGFWDLRTTEVPDEIPALMITFGLGYWFFASAQSQNFAPLLFSIAIGTIVLIAGLLLYKAGQWGAADAWVLAAIAYVIPLYSGKIFIIDYLLNLLVVGSAYMIVYAAALGVSNPHVKRHYIDDLKKNRKIVAGIPALFLIFILALSYFSYTAMGYVGISPLAMLLLVTFLTLFWRYGITIEKNVFRKRIATEKLKVGDVVEDMIWRGIEAEEIKKLRKQKKYVIVKEGIRFVPAFPLALIVTLVYGNLLLLLLGL